MPVFIPKDANPFGHERTSGGKPKDRREKLKLPQARVLKALMPRRPDQHPSEWPLLTRSQLCVRAGYSEISGSITRALNGIRPGNKTSGEPHPGVIERGLVETTELDIDGVMEVNYRITPLGVSVFQAYLSEYGDDLPPLREAALCTNQRYAKKEA